MNYQEKLNKIQRNLKIFICTLAILGNAMTVLTVKAEDETEGDLSHSQTEPATVNPSTNSTPTSTGKITCESLNDPSKLKKKIVTIVEEPIGKSNDLTTVLDCFRETKCITSNNRTTCVPSYKLTCDPLNTNTICQPVQAYLGESGAGLLFIYVSHIYQWSASLIGIMCVLFIIVGGIQMAASQGESEEVSAAKERIMQSIGGLVLLFMSALLLYAINPNFFTK